MLPSKLEVLLDLGPVPDQNIVNKTVKQLKTLPGVTEVIFKDGSVVVETILPSTLVVDVATRASGRKAVLQGFGDTESAVAMVTNQGAGTRVAGVVRFQQTEAGPLVADVCIDGLAPGRHGLHIHETGDLSEGCKSIGGHFNPHNSPHGGPLDPPQRRHAGDLGNILADDTGRAAVRLTLDSLLKVSDIVGRSVGVTSGPDDLGRGSGPKSKVDGNTGGPIACGIIARSAGIFENPKRICACDGVVVWDERDRPLAGAGRRTCCDGQGGQSKPCCKV